MTEKEELELWDTVHDLRTLMLDWYFVRGSEGFTVDGIEAFKRLSEGKAAP